MVIEKSRRKTVYVTTIYSNVEICHTPSLTWCPKMHTNFNEKTRWPLECQLKIWIEMAAIITEGLVCQGILLSNQVTSPLQIRMESPEACDADFYTVFFFRATRHFVFLLSKFKWCLNFCTQVKWKKTCPSSRRIKYVKLVSLFQDVIIIILRHSILVTNRSFKYRKGVIILIQCR